MPLDRQDSWVNTNEALSGLLPSSLLRFLEMIRSVVTGVVIACAAVSVGAVQMTLDRRAIEEAIYIGQSRIETERERFHTPYRVRVTQPPIDWIDVITPFHRVELAAEMNARRGGRQFWTTRGHGHLGRSAEPDRPGDEMTFHPLNNFVAVPSYQVEVIPASGVHASNRDDSIGFLDSGRAQIRSGQLSRCPTPSAVFGGGLPVVGGTMIAALDGSTFDPQQPLQVVVLDGKTELARAGSISRGCDRADP